MPHCGTGNSQVVLIEMDVRADACRCIGTMPAKEGRDGEGIGPQGALHGAGGGEVRARRREAMMRGQSSSRSRTCLYR